MANKVTMEDIARKLNISKSAVSRAISDKYGVSQDLRLKVLSTAVKYGYDFSSLRKKNKRYFDITVVLQRSFVEDNRYYYKILRGIDNTLSEQRVNMSLHFIDFEGVESSAILDTFTHNTDGYIILGEISFNYYLEITSTGIPCVFIDPIVYFNNSNCIFANNFQSMYDATDFLVKNGHKRIVFVGSESFSYSFIERKRGFLQYAQENSDSNVEFQYVDEFTKYIGENLKLTHLDKLLESGYCPDGIICANDIIAFAVYNILKKYNLRIPEDVSVIGFDDDEIMCNAVKPSLTTVASPNEELGVSAVELILKWVKTQHRHYEFVQLGTTIVERDSVLFNR